MKRTGRRPWSWIVVGLLVAVGCGPRLPSESTTAEVNATATPPRGAGLTWDQAMNELARGLSDSLRTSSSGRLKVAVIDFTTIRGAPCTLGAAVAEGLITPLFRSDRFEVIERRQLERVLQELRMSSSDLLDPDSAARLGRILGADGLVTGTIAATPGSYRVNSRIILVETTALVSATETRIARNVEVDALGRCHDTDDVIPTGSAVSTPRSPEPRGKAPTPWSEDFSRSREGDPLHEWGKNLIAIKGRDGRMYLTSQLPGAHRASKRVLMGASFDFEFDWSSFRTYSHGRVAPWVRVPVSLVDERQRRFRFEIGNSGLKLSGRPVKSVHVSRMNRFRLERRGSEYRFFHNGDFLMTVIDSSIGNVIGFEFEVPVTTHGDGQYFTAFQVTPVGGSPRSGASPPGTAPARGGTELMAQTSDTEQPPLDVEPRQRHRFPPPNGLHWLMFIGGLLMSGLGVWIIVDDSTFDAESCTSDSEDAFSRDSCIIGGGFLAGFGALSIITGFWNWLATARLDSSSEDHRQ